MTPRAYRRTFDRGGWVARHLLDAAILARGGRMNEQPLDRYRGLFTQLLFEREAAGGDIPEGEESRYVALLDEIWWQLSQGDQELIERELKQVTVQVGEGPEFVDPLSVRPGALDGAGDVSHGPACAAAAVRVEGEERFSLRKKPSL